MRVRHSAEHKWKLVFQHNISHSLTRRRIHVVLYLLRCWRCFEYVLHTVYLSYYIYIHWVWVGWEMMLMVLKPCCGNWILVCLFLNVCLWVCVFSTFIRQAASLWAVPIPNGFSSTPVRFIQMNRAHICIVHVLILCIRLIDKYLCLHATFSSLWL